MFLSNLQNKYIKVNQLFIHYIMNLIVACDQYGIIGDNGKMPWHVSEDMKYFKDMTLNHIVVMGRKTYESLPSTDGLKGRINIVITSLPELYSQLVNKDLLFVTISELSSVIQKIQENENISGKKVFVIGGSNIYNQLMNYCNNIYVTYIYRNSFQGDTFLSVDYKTLVNKGYKLTSITDIKQSKNELYLYQFAHYIKEEMTNN